MTKPLNEQVVVITGASSGIGRETALELARRGASVVLAARSEEALREVAREIEQMGGKAMVAVTDVAEWSQVQRLAEQAAFSFGRIDTWVNNAGVSTYATVEDSDIEELERVIQVNLMGEIYGVKAVLPIMKQQGEGTIINVSSVLGETSVPLQAAYAASKHGVKGFSDALRLELAREPSGINVTVILPSSMNTPFFNNARSKLGVKPRPIAPVYQPRSVAQAIAFAAEHPRREIVVGGGGKMFVIFDHLSRSLLDWFMLAGDNMAKQQKSDQPDDGRDNLFQPIGGQGRVEGDYGDQSAPNSLYTSLLEVRPALKRTLLGASLVGGATAAALLLRGKRLSPM